MEEKSLLDKVLDMSKDELFPKHEIVLPSRGLYYDDMIPNGTVNIRPMNIFTEKMLANSSVVKGDNGIGGIIKNCVEFPSEFDIRNLLIGDVNYILYVLRAISYGNIYEFTVMCDNCNSPIQMQYDFNNMNGSVKWANENIIEPFEITLPDISKKLREKCTVKMRFARRYDSENGNQGISNLIIEALGSKEKVKINKFYGERLSIKDKSIITDKIKEVTPGINTTVEVKCSKCGNNMEKVGLPITEEFFRYQGD